ncbi:hypothetical protein Tco_0813859 [Tanacetum coccineum]
MVRCSSGLEAVIRTSWTNRNPGHRFYGCPTLSPTCVNFLRWFDPPMCQKSIQIIPGLLKSRNELKEILVMVEEKRLKLMKFLIISWVVFRVLANSTKLPEQLLVYFDMQKQREARLANELSNLMMQLVESVNERRAFIEELEHLPRNLVAYKTREELKRLQKDDLIKVIEMRKVNYIVHPEVTPDSPVLSKPKIL